MPLNQVPKIMEICSQFVCIKISMELWLAIRFFAENSCRGINATLTIYLDGSEVSFHFMIFFLFCIIWFFFSNREYIMHSIIHFSVSYMTFKVKYKYTIFYMPGILFKFIYFFEICVFFFHFCFFICYLNTWF